MERENRLKEQERKKERALSVSTSRWDPDYDPPAPLPKYQEQASIANIFAKSPHRLKQTTSGNIGFKED